MILICQLEQILKLETSLDKGVHVDLQGRCSRKKVTREYLRPADGTVQMVVRNSGTMPSTPAGRGLKAFSDKLRPFGGSLTGQVLVGEEWTFAAVATLPLWHGG